MSSIACIIQIGYNSGVRSARLYRCFDGDGVLLYIGASGNALARVEQHQRGQPWGNRVKRVEIEAYPDQASALTAEKRAIIMEKPLYNVLVDGRKIRKATGGMSKNTEYCRAWRHSHRKAYNAYMAKYKRKRRKEAKRLKSEIQNTPGMPL